MAWRAAASRLIHPMNVEYAEDVTLTGRLRRSRVSGLDTVHVTGTMSEVDRTRTLIGSDEPDRLSLTLVISGSLDIEQGESGDRLTEGDLTWYRSTEPYRITARSDFELAHFLVDARWAPVLGDRLAGPAGRVTTDSLLGSLLSPMLRSVDEIGAVPLPPRDGSLELAIAQFISTIGAKSEAPKGYSSDRYFARACGYIRRRFGDPDLGPAQVAAALHMSVRLLHKVFHDNGDTVGAYIRKIRLEQAMRMLTDPLDGPRSLHDIAAHCGYSSYSHFSRSFKQMYGSSPSGLLRA